VDFLNHYIEKTGCDLSQSMSIGDGANDLPMLRTCQDAQGLGMGFYAKDSVAANLINVIRFGTLETALYVQSYTDNDIVR
jgi:phosphoserine phosphatase